MKLFVPATGKDLREARAWVNNTHLRQCMAALDQALVHLEKRHGECVVYVETNASPTSNLGSRQIDLMIVLPDRIAVCEIKQGLENAPSLHHLHTAIDQLDLRERLLKSQLRDLDSGCLRKLVWAPHISEGVLRRLIADQDLTSSRHIAVTSSNPAHGSILSYSRGSSYFPQALVHELSMCEPARAPNRAFTGQLGAAIGGAYEAAGIDLLTFSSFARLQAFLAHAVTDTVLIPEAEHVPGLRPSELARGRAMLEDSHMLEVCGPTGVGKTSFIREMLADFPPLVKMQTSPLPPFVAHNVASLRDLLQLLAEQTGMFQAERLDVLEADEVLQLLVDAPHLFWVRDYDPTSEEALRRLIAMLRSRATDGAAYWVFETLRPASVEGDAPGRERLALAPLGNASIARILQLRDPSPTAEDMANVIDAAQGIPLLAVMRWTLDFEDGGFEPHARPDRYEIFLRHLPQRCRSLVAPIAYIINEAPLGCTMRLVEQWCRLLGHLARGDPVELARLVLGRARDQRLISLEAFGSKSASQGKDVFALAPGDVESAAALRDAILPTSLEDARIAWIHVVDPHFIDHFVGTIDAATRDDWRSQLQLLLAAESSVDLSLTGVTFSILVDDFTPFLRSSFRSSSAMLPRLKAWAERRDRLGTLSIPAEDRAYFLYWLSWITDHYWDEPREGAKGWKLSPPTANNSFQRLMWDIARTRGQFHRDGETCDWEGWERAAEDFKAKGEMDLWAEATMRRAQAFLRPPKNDLATCWRLMRAVLDEETRLSQASGRGLVYFHVLSLLNKRKRLGEAGVEDATAAARELAPVLIPRMVESGLVGENVNSAANATFFFVRMVELGQHPASEEDVETYAELLRFVQRISPARKVQALLTEGSIHRHYCMSGAPTFERYLSHADAALEIFDRARQAATRAGMVDQVGNSLSYAGQVLTRALRYGPQPQIWDWLGGHLRRLDAYAAAVDAFDASSTRSLGLLAAIHRSRAVLHWVAAVGLDTRRLETLADTFSLTFERARAALANAGRETMKKEYAAALKDFERMLRFTASLPAHQDAVLRCEGLLEGFVESVIAICPGNPAWRDKSDVYRDAMKVRRLIASA